MENYSFFVWLSVSFDRKSLSQTFFKMFFFCFPKFSSSIIFPRSTSAIQNQTANIISSRKRPKMTICLTSLFDNFENCPMRLLAWTKRHKPTTKSDFFASLSGFLNFSSRVIFLSFVFNIPASGICIFSKIEDLKCYLREYFHDCQLILIYY